MKIRYRDISCWKYELAESVSLQTNVRPIGPAIRTDYITLTTDGILGIAKGYAWDGPSGPAVDTPDFMRGSLVHDALYQLIRMGLLPVDARHKADDELLHIMLEDGMSQVRAAWVYEGVRAFGWSACSGPKEADRNVIKEAP